MDEKDFQIMTLLQENAKQTTSVIAKRLGIPITTVYHRIRKLEKEGIIEKYSLRLNYEKLGKPLTALILVTIGYVSAHKQGQAIDKLLERVCKVIPVEEAYSLTGAFDIFVKVRAANIHELNKIINTLRIVEQIDKTQTMIVLHEIKR